MTLDELQILIERMYSGKDRERGTAATFLWLCEEIGELATALREGSQEAKATEFADVIAWLVTLANINDVNLTRPWRPSTAAGVRVAVTSFAPVKANHSREGRQGMRLVPPAGRTGYTAGCGAGL